MPRFVCLEQIVGIDQSWLEILSNDTTEVLVQMKIKTHLKGWVYGPKCN